MADVSGLESFLGIPVGSTPSARDIPKSTIKADLVIAKEVKSETAGLAHSLARIELAEKMTPSDIVKFGISVEDLENDKVRIREQAIKVHDIAMRLLARYEDEVNNLVDVNDRMWASGAKLIDSVTGSSDKLLNMALKLTQDAQMKSMMQPEAESEDTKEKDMSPSDWISFIEEVQEKNQSK